MISDRNPRALRTRKRKIIIIQHVYGATVIIISRRDTRSHVIFSNIYCTLVPAAPTRSNTLLQRRPGENHQALCSPDVYGFFDVFVIVRERGEVYFSGWFFFYHIIVHIFFFSPREVSPHHLRFIYVLQFYSANEAISATFRFVNTHSKYCAL